MISQREARRLRTRVSELEKELKATWQEWRLEFMPGTFIVAEPNATSEARAAIEVARRLGHRVLAKVDGGRILFYAKRAEKLL